MNSKKLGKIIASATLATGCSNPEMEITTQAQQKVIHEIRVIVQPQTTPTTAQNSQESTNSKEIVEKTIILGENGKIETLKLEGLFNNITVKNASEAKVVIKGLKELVEKTTTTAMLNSTIRNKYSSYSIMNGIVYLQEEGGFTGTINGQMTGTPYTIEEIPSLEIYIPERADLRLGAGIGLTTIATVGNLKLSSSGNSKVEVASSTDTAIDISGNGQIEMGRTEDLSISSSGNGTVKVASCKDTTIDLSGGGYTVLDEVISSSTKIEVSGEGEVSIKKGSISQLSVDTSGSSMIQVFATVHDLNVDISGSSTVKVPHITGSVREDISGSGQLLTQ